ARLVDRLVELVVCASPEALLAHADVAAVAAPRLRSLQRGPELALRVLQSQELLAGGALGRELGGGRLGRGAHLVGAAGLARGEPADDGAPVRLQLDEAVRLELAQSLPHRRPAHPELLRESFLAQACPRRQVAAEHARV